MTERTCGNLNVLGKVSEDVDFINNILLNDYASYSSMRALECFIDEKIHQGGVKMPGRVFPVLKGGEDWKKTGKTVGKGTYGSVNLDTIFKKSLIASKIFNRNSTAEDVMKEYSLGIKAVNLLRYYCPNFCYTLGAYCQGSNNIIAYEYIGKKNFLDFCRENNGNAAAFLEIFIQVLVALDIGQQKIFFMQNDMSNANIMIRDKKDTYSVIMGDMQYTFRDVNVPVIIDYGFSDAVVDSKVITGVTDPGYVGKYPFLIPGYDMYFLLADTYLYSRPTGELKKLLDDIFRNYYGKHNPYDLERTSARPAEQWAGIIYTKAASFTPGGLARWLLQNYGHLVKNIVVGKRERYEINSIQVLEQFSKISPNKFDRRINQCFEHNVSFIMARYFARDVEVEIENIYSAMDNDRKIFEKFSDIKMPHDIKQKCEEILDMKMKIDHSKRYMDIVESHIDYLRFMENLELYVNLFYMTLEQKIDNPIYIEFYKKFSESEVFKQYQENLNMINAARRWLVTLLLFRISEPISTS